MKIRHDIDLYPHVLPANIAQLVEQLICNQPVGGSSPSVGSDFSLGEENQRRKA